jgi:transcriptional regulator with XRE-family HTH domain
LSSKIIHIMKDFFERIITLRNYLNLSGEEFARRTKVTPGYLSKVESGKNTFSRKVVNRLVTEFGVSRIWIETGEGPMLSVPEKGPQNAGEKKEGISGHGGRDQMENDLIAKVLRVLRSETPYRAALINNIDAFHVGVDDYERLRNLHPQKIGLRLKI